MISGQETFSDSSNSNQRSESKLAINTPEFKLRDNISMKSSAFEADKVIPRIYTGDGENKSPPLTWMDIPDGTLELVLLCEDPDAPQPQAFVHWLVYGVSPEITSLAEGVEPVSGATCGFNSNGESNYTGPNPPLGHGLHHYHFQLFALDTKLALKTEALRDEVVDAMKGHVLACGDLVGTYERM